MATQTLTQRRPDASIAAPVPIAALAGPAPWEPVEVPPLLKGYLKAGARLLGEPHLDPQFRCADLPVMLDVRALDARLRTRLGGATPMP